MKYKYLICNENTEVGYEKYITCIKNKSTGKKIQKV